MTLDENIAMKPKWNFYAYNLKIGDSLERICWHSFLYRIRSYHVFQYVEREHSSTSVFCEYVCVCVCAR